MGRELFERDAEISTLGSLLEEARAGQGSSCWIEGEAGTGKSSLLAALGDGSAGANVLYARGGELEREYPFGIVRQLFEELVLRSDDERRARVLSGAAGSAVAALTDVDIGGGAPDVSFAVFHGLYWLLANLAEEGPLLVLVDDMHWCDDASLQWLSYVAPRLDGLRALVVLASRPEHADDGQLLRDQLSLGSLRVRLGPLSLEGVTALVRSVDPRANDAFCAASFDAAGGNPFFTNELIREATAEEIFGEDGSAARLQQIGPRSVSRAVLLRVGRLGRGAIDLARAAATLGRDTPLMHAALLADLEPSDARRAAGSMVDAGVFSAVDPVDFVHPIVRQAIYADQPEAERSAAHGRAATLLARIGGSLEEQAAHLLRTPPTGEVAAVETLHAASAEAIRRGAPDAAIAYLNRARAETVDLALRAQITFQLGSIEAFRFRPEAHEHLSEALALAHDPLSKAMVAQVLAFVRVIAGDTASAVDVLHEAIEGVQDVDPQLALGLESDLITYARIDLSTRPLSLERVARLRDSLTNDPRSRSEGLATAELAVEATSAGEHWSHCAELARRALEGGALLGPGAAETVPAMLAVLVLMFCDQLEEADADLNQMLEDAIRRASPIGIAHAYCFRAHVAYRRGRVLDALADAQASLEATEQPLPQILPMQVAVLVDAYVERGDLVAAEAALSAFGLDGQVDGPYHINHLLESRGRLRIAQGRMKEALHDLLDAGRRQEAFAMPNPAIVAWRSAAATAAAAMGDRDEALLLADAEVGLARSFGAPRALGIALNAFGLAAGGTDGISAIREAVVVLDGSGARLAQARALVSLGGALRRANQRKEAREPLELGFEIAEACHASSLADYATDELRATGARPRGLRRTGIEALTPSELRVSRLAAAGKSNPEIAQALFVTRKTVEDHLSSAYRKLGISVRQELANSLAPTADAQRPASAGRATSGA